MFISPRNESAISKQSIVVFMIKKPSQMNTYFNLLILSMSFSRVKYFSLSILFSFEELLPSEVAGGLSVETLVLIF